MSVHCENCFGSTADWLRGQGDVLWTVQDIRQTDAGPFLCALCRQHPGQPIKAKSYEECKRIIDAERRRIAA